MLFEMYGINLSTDLHKCSRISADDKNQRNSELEIRLSAVDDPGDRRQEAARGSFRRPKLYIDGIYHIYPCISRPFRA